MPYSDTPEQAAVISWSGHSQVVRAFAGTGKTSTLVRFALAPPESRMLYVAYNRAVRDETEQKFPFNMECKTSHQLAGPNFGRYYQHRLTGNLHITNVASQLNIRHWPLARTAIFTFNAFLCSGDTGFRHQHLPDDEARSGLSDGEISAAAKRLWHEFARQGGTFPVTHDVYLKLYQLSRPDFSTRWHTVLFKEGQDANPVTQSLVLTQCCNVVLVGDRHQQIYRFFGAENALDALQLADAVQLFLTRSLRFGPAVAGVANMLLARQGETLAVVGHGGSDNLVAHLLKNAGQEHIAILSRTVVGVIGTALQASLAGEKVYWVGGIAGYKTEEMEDLYWFSADMPERMQSPQLVREYRNFDEFEAVVSSTKDADINQARVTVSTAHRSKGLEWPVVVLDEDFSDITDPLIPECRCTDETNLLYVAVTRARQTLVINPLLQALMAEERDPPGETSC